jgi:hypothetical protein
MFHLLVSFRSAEWRAALVVAVLLVFAGSAAAGTIENETFWKDTAGNFIFSQGGGMIQVGDTFYWYGANYNNAAVYAANPGPGSVGNATFKSVTCYSSSDLAHWKFEGDALARDQVGRGWFGRLGVAFNRKTKKYVMVAQGAGPDGNAGEYFATSDSPTGPFKFAATQRNMPFIVNGGTGDQTVFQDDDGKAYVICSNKNGRSHLYVAPLNPEDFLSITGATEISAGSGREGNCMFKYNGTYYFCSSDLHGWNASPTHVIASKNILGPYSPETPMINTDLDFSRVSQTGFFFNVHGSDQTTVIFAGDRWSDFAGNGMGYNQWCPLSFDGAAPVFNSLSQWDIDVKTGRWSVGLGNNYILNPSFEADRVAQTQLAGWTNTTDIVGASPNGNARKGEAHTGNFAMAQWYSAKYNATMLQNIAHLPNATYTLTAWVKSSGGQNNATISVKNLEGPDQTVSIARPIDSWTQVVIPGIKVTRGACQIAITSDANADNWIEVDDLSLVNADFKLAQE